MPAWSPDGRWVAFTSAVTSARADDVVVPEVFVVSADGLTEKRLTSNEATCMWPSWSPDGQWLVYRTGSSGDLAIISADGTAGSELSANPAYEDYPSWCPVPADGVTLLRPDAWGAVKAGSRAPGR